MTNTSATGLEGQSEPNDAHDWHALEPRLDAAIASAVDFIRKEQLPSGAFISDECFEPRTSAVHLITLCFIGRVPAVDARGYARFLASTQREDGSFPPYPYAPQGDLSSTAIVFAALQLADLPEQATVRSRALEFVKTHGGFDAVVQRLFDRGDLTAVYLAMAGIVDPFTLPDPDLSFMVVPGALKLMLRKINAGIVEVMIFVGSVTRYLRQRQRPVGYLLGKEHALEAKRSIEFVESWLNPNGNNNGTTVQSDQAIATLVALGRSPESTSVYSCTSWFDKHKIWDERGLHLRAFFNHNWMTAWCLRALLFAGVRRDEPLVHEALDFLCWSQSKLPMPKLNLSRDDAHLEGGWGFEDDNLILPDTDDTSAVLGALGVTIRSADAVGLGAQRRERVQDAIDLGLHNLLDMQSDNGGWAAFVWNLGDKPPGPLFDKPLSVPRTLREKLEMFLKPPIELGEPAVSGLTGRVLQGLGALGYRASSPVVQNAARFLKRDQMPNGMFWERWFVAYLAGTACTLSGLADCGWDMQEPWLQKAIRWLLSRQNPDGGWGETPAAYEDTAFAGVGPSMPPLTGHVLIALIDAGLADHAAVERGIEYLLRTQEPRGRWSSEGWLQVYEPNSTYYFYDGAALYAPLEALAKLKRARAGHALERRVSSIEQLRERPAAGDRSLRLLCDPVADEVIASIFARSEQFMLRQSMASLTTLQDPLPALMPVVAREYFSATEQLPSFADPELIARGQQLFERHSCLLSTVLLCSSLPQTYAAKHGARVLAQTQGMTRNVHLRVLNTAQFLFDVCMEGGLGPSGRGIRSAQKVRLAHATVRAMLRERGGWDDAHWGAPVNQEDLLGTCMAFSIVLLEGLERAGVRVSTEDQEAFFHLWMVVGSLLGLPDALRPEDVSRGRLVMQQIRASQWQASVHGRMLARQLVSSMRRYLPGGPRAVPHALIRFLAGDVCADMLDIPRGPEAAWVLHLAAASAFVPKLAEPLMQRLGRQLVVRAVSAQRHGEPARFRIPSGLSRTWQRTD